MENAIRARYGMAYRRKRRNCCQGVCILSPMYPSNPRGSPPQLTPPRSLKARRPNDERTRREKVWPRPSQDNSQQSKGRVTQRSRKFNGFP